MEGRQDTRTAGALDRDASVVARETIHAPSPPLPGTLTRLWLAIRAVVLSPCFAWKAGRLGVPGLPWRRVGRRLAWQFLRRGRGTIPLPVVYRTAYFPMDSTRYFEFDVMGRALGDAAGVHYLDVSSPRLFPLASLRERPSWTAELVNPDPHDLAITRSMVDALGLTGRCGLHACAIDAAPWPDASFDLVTCMSVLEHIPDDLAAVRAIWRLLKPGGRLLLTVPCAVRESEQYIDRNEYGVLEPDADGLVFWQRFYDEARLAAQVFSVTGPPARRSFYGEKERGSFQRNAAWKRSDPRYPIWREPLMMAREYASFPSAAALPGEGVAALEFVKG